MTATRSTRARPLGHGGGRSEARLLPLRRDTTSTEGAVLDLQRTAGNRAVTSLVTLQRDGTALQEKKPIPDPWAEKEKTRWERFEDWVNMIGYRIFAEDPVKAMGLAKLPEVTPELLKEMTSILDTAVARRDHLLRQYVTQDGMKHDEAMLKANQQAFGHLPASWRPKNTTEAEVMVKKIEAKFSEERVAKMFEQQDAADTIALTDKATLKRDRARAFKGTVTGTTGRFAEEKIKQHEKDEKARDKWKKERAAQWKKEDEARKKEFERQQKMWTERAAKLKKKAKVNPGLADAADKAAGMASGLKAAFDLNEQDILRKRKLDKYEERMSHLPPDERKKRLELKAKSLGIEAEDPAGLASEVMRGIASVPDSLGTGAKGLRSALPGMQSASQSLPGALQSHGMKKFGTKDVSGYTGQDKEFTNSAGGKMKFASGGLGNQIGGISTSAGNLTNLGANIASLVKSVRGKGKGDPAQQLQAGNEIFNNVTALGEDSMKLGQDGIKLAQAFGSSAVGQQAAAALPGFGIGLNFLKLVKNGKSVVDHAGRYREVKAVGNDVGDDHVMQLTSSLVVARSLRLAAHYTIEAISAGLSMAGDIVTLTGVGAAVGGMVKLAGTAVGGANAAARAISDSYGAGKTIEARQSQLLALPGGAEKMLRDDPKAAAQAFIFKAREGNPLGLRVLAAFGVTADKLKLSSDENIRSLILATLELQENPENIGAKVGGGIRSLKALVPKIGAGIRDFVMKPYEVKQLAKAKNALGYGGVKDRGLGWKLKNFFTAPGTVPEQKMNIRKLLEASSLDADAKKKYLAMTMTYEERKAAAEKEKRPDIEISAPQSWSKPVAEMSSSEVRQTLAQTLEVDDGSIQKGISDFSKNLEEAVGGVKGG